MVAFMARDIEAFDGIPLAGLIKLILYLKIWQWILRIQ